MPSGSLTSGWRTRPASPPESGRYRPGAGRSGLRRRSRSGPSSAIRSRPAPSMPWAACSPRIRRNSAASFRLSCARDDGDDWRHGRLGALGGLGQMMRRIGGMMVGGQTGAAIGALAEEVVSSTDVGLPLGRKEPRRCCPRASPHSAKDCLSTRTKSGCSWPCVRRRTTGCSRTCPGCAPGCSALSRTMRGASPWTPRHCATLCLRSTRQTLKR